jgi:hypothetical protein
MTSSLATSGGQSDYCECALDYLQENVPYAEVTSGASYDAAISACAGEAK